MDSVNDQEFLDTFTCPISNEIFNEPVMCEDGHTYEKIYIEQWLKNNNTSPLTRQIMSKKMCVNFQVKKLVDALLKINPDLTKTQCNPHLISCIINNNFNQLLNYKYFRFRSLLKFKINDKSVFQVLLENCNDVNIVSHVISVIQDNEHVDENGNTVMHYVCRYAYDTVIRNYIDKKNLVNANKFDRSLISKIVSTGYVLPNFERKNKLNQTPYDIICLTRSYELIDYVFSRTREENAFSYNFVNDKLIEKNSLITAEQKKQIRKECTVKYIINGVIHCSVIATSLAFLGLFVY